MLWCYSLPMISGLQPLRPLHRPQFRSFLRVLSVACAASLSAACSSGDDDGETPPPPPSGVTIKITDAEQYTSQADLEVPVVETASTNITVNWAAVTSDLQCHAVMPSTDIINTSFIK